MYESHSKRTKRKCKSTKHQKWKRTKFPATGLFQEQSFDSSDDDSIVSNEISCEKTLFLAKELNNSLNITPSKSETDPSFVVPSEDEVINEVPEDCDESYVLSEGKYDVESDEDHSFLYNSVIDEIINESGVSVNSRICSTVETEEKPVETKAPITNGFEKKEKFEKKSVQNKIEKKSVQNKFSTQSTQTFQSKDGTILILNKNECSYFYGLCTISVLHGKIEILGYNLDKNSPEIQAYSMRGSSLLYIKNITKHETAASDYLLKSDIIEKAKSFKKCAIVLCKKLDDHKILFIEKHISQQFLPKIAKGPRVVFKSNDGTWNLLNVNPAWDNVIEGIGSGTKFMICGGKGVGKTTFLRYALNRLLLRFSQVRVIDLDPGQAEFTVPGCISIVLVEEPVFGINYTHLRKSERSILSNINIAYEPDKYLYNVEELLSSKMDDIPTLINYMGYTHGIGLNILSAVIQCVKPTHVLQIKSTNIKKNYKFILTPETVQQHAKLFVPCKSDLKYVLYQIESMSDVNDGWTAESRQLREMCTLSYLSQMAKSDSIFQSKAPIYKISLKDIQITNLNSETLTPACVNASLVALCVWETTKTFKCFGYGIVRGIDSASNELVLQTSEGFEVLEQVTHLVQGGATLPPSIYMTPDDVTGHLPYVIEGNLMSFGQFTKRSHLSVKNK